MKRLSWAILVFLPVGAFAADVYRSVDANGLVVYSDRPSESAERVAVRATTRAAAAQGNAAEGEDEDAQSNLPPGAEIPREATPEEIASDRARNCEYARQMVSTYSQSHRLFRTGADGERVYLSDAEIDEARTRAESNVATWCG